MTHYMDWKKVLSILTVFSTLLSDDVYVYHGDCVNTTFLFWFYEYPECFRK